MKRVIYIPVSEFIDNGGDIIKKQHCFTSNGIYLGVVKWYNNYNIELTNGRFGSLDDIYVEVDCTPIYD